MILPQSAAEAEAAISELPVATAVPVAVVTKPPEGPEQPVKGATAVPGLTMAEQVQAAAEETRRAVALEAMSRQGEPGAVASLTLTPG